MKAITIYRTMRREGYSRTYARHVAQGVTIYTCTNSKCLARHPHGTYSPVAL